MALVSDDKHPMPVRLSECGEILLGALAERLRMRRSGVVLTAVRVCSMAHGCANQPGLFVRQGDGQFVPFSAGRCSPPVISKTNDSPVVLMCTVRERATLERCGRLAGGLLVGVETALEFLLNVTSERHPFLFERRGSVYYPVVGGRCD